MNALSPAPVTTPQSRATPAEARPFVRVDGISHRYGRGAPVLEDICFNVRRGEVLALIGRSGCGKSTLLHLLAGLSTPGAGQVHIGDRPVTGPSNRWVMMFQSPSLFPWMTVFQNVELGLRFDGRRTQAKHRVPQVLELVDLSAFGDRNVQDLSGGQQQRVALARSLAPEPDILLLDEPFSALDAFTRRSLQGEVRRIAKSLGLTLILVTHDVGEAALMADRAVLLTSGPGRVAADTDIALDDDDRSEATRAFRAETARLSQLYAEVAGMSAATDTPRQKGSAR
ncbi:MAG: ABC transporter ATP-binding protein [Rhodobacteraceae bacterium]|nr:ABC transporter ATP-binding protein [Paracoccaceae bacterium]